jgi:hypothetical protein
MVVGRGIDEAERKRLVKGWGRERRITSRGNILFGLRPGRAQSTWTLP